MGNIVNWDKVDWKNQSHRQVIKAKLQEFLRVPSSKEYKEMLAKVQEFGTSSDFPASVLSIVQKIQTVPMYDNGYEELFDMKDIRASKRNGIEVAAVTDSLVFNKVLEGEKAKVYQMAGNKISITCDMYGGGLSWSRKLIDDEEFWTLENNAVAFRNRYYSTKAANFYALIDAVDAAHNLAWQAPLPAALGVGDATYVANRDIVTINAAAQQIITDMANTGVGPAPEGASFIILAPLQLQMRLRMALGLNLQPFAQSPQFKNFNFRMITTTMLAATDVYYVIFPKVGLIGLDRMDMTIFSDFDILSYSDVAVAWGRYGGGIVDQDQVVRCATA